MFELRKLTNLVISTCAASAAVRTTVCGTLLIEALFRRSKVVAQLRFLRYAGLSFKWDSLGDKNSAFRILKLLRMPAVCLLQVLFAFLFLTVNLSLQPS